MLAPTGQQSYGTSSGNPVAQQTIQAAQIVANEKQQRWNSGASTPADWQ